MNNEEQDPQGARPAAERRQMEAALRQSEQRYLSLFEQSMDAVLLTDLDGRILAANPAACRLFGRSEDELGWIGREGVVDPADPHLAEALEKGTRTRRFRGEITLVRGDGTRFPAELSTVTCQDKDGLNRTITIIRDITERKRLLQSEADLEEAQRVTKVGSWKFDVATNAVRWSKELCRIFDVEEKAFDRAYESFLSCIHPEDRPRVLQANAEARSEGKPFEVEYRVLTRGGRVKTIREIGYAVKNAAGEVAGLFGTAQDITERKRSEDALRQTDARLQVILGASPIPILGIAADGTIESWNEAAERVFGWSAKEAIGRLCPTVAPREMEDYLAMVRKAMQGEPSLGLVRYRQKKSGSLVLCRISAAPQLDAQGRALGVTVLLEDVTEREQAEAALRESEERLRLLDDNLPDSYVYQFTLEADGTPRFLYLSAGVQRVHGVSAEAGLRDASTLRHQAAPEQLATLAEAEDASLRDMSDFERELKVCRADGQWRWVQLRSRPRRNSKGQIIWDGVATDITERKQAAEALRESEERFSSAFKNSAIGMALVAPDGRWLQVNRGLCSQLGYTEGELLATKFHDITHPDDLENDLANMRRMLSGEIQSYQMEKRYFRKSGDIVWGLLSVSLVGNSRGDPAYFVTQIQDITERKRHEETIRRQFVEIAYYYDNAPIGLAVLDTDLRFVRINKQLAENNGIPASEHIGKSVDEIVPTLAAQARKVAAQIIRTGHPVANMEFSGEMAAQPGVPHIWLEGWYPLFGDDRRITGFTVIVQDITERKQTEAALRQSREQLRALLARLERLQEDERTRMAREVHDVLGQMLTGLKMDMSWWERRFTKIADEPLRSSLEEKVQATSRLADTMIETVQKISRDLRPSVLDNIGLGAALHFEARQFQERSGIACEVSVPAETYPLEPDLATGIFRIFQELLTNTARHAGATLVVVALSQTAENVTLEVRDNGRGIRDGELRDPKSLGLLGMTERASLIGGTLEILGSPGTGTKATLTIPVSTG